MDNPIELGAIFRLTQRGRRRNLQTRMINAQQFDHLPQNTSYILTAFMAADEHNEEEVRLLDQWSPNNRPLQLDMSVDNLNTYYRRHWIERVNIGRPEITFPMLSVWRPTAEGLPAREQPRRGIQIAAIRDNPTHNWIVLQLSWDREHHMSQRIILQDKTELDDNGEIVKKNLHLEMVFSWFQNGWIERVDMARMDVDSDMDAEDTDTFNAARNPYCLGDIKEQW